ncbi:mitotic spindle assembly checkpoint protein MAD1 isoform X2 [Callorhinchus milii]|uniref:Mitotic arrest deficient 1 like 1 n=1 Tax=Callorhinchus milii TaxID=7868 RepID=V9KGM9_CALMI|nr:mitotic spindle assembly checkpoint protein MAD1 isoform X2 [Callorhinchus milii]|eukprot:gi/632974936/ref/XP_007903950.1/ PREDICTED: mitotic spindle assembly checkpoint protein MAD1 isoform X2 [Callorhinchus milii]
MDDLDDNTTVFSTLRSFNNFLSQASTSTSNVTEPSSIPNMWQLQYQQKMQAEEQAEDVRSKTRVLEVEREKQKIELSHKRARIELEKAAQTSSWNYEREADRNQELMVQVKQIQEKEAETQEKLKEQVEMNKTLKKNMELQNKKLQETEEKLAESNQTIDVLKANVSELQWKSMSQEMQLTTSTTERQELLEQVEIQRKKWQEAVQKAHDMETAQAVSVENEQRIKELESKISQQEQDSIIVNNMRSDLSRIPEFEKELRQLKEENTYYREMEENNLLLKEETESLRKKIERLEKLKEEKVTLELKNEKLLAKLRSWENVEQTSGLNIRSPEDLSREIVLLQQREILLKQQNSSVTTSARMLEKARKQLQEQVLKLRTQILTEQKKREQQEANARRMEKRNILLTKARDGMRSILDSYDNELVSSSYTPQLNRRVREAEDMVQKLHAHISELEFQLSRALEDVGNHKLKTRTLEAELSVLKSQVATTDSSNCITSEEGNALRQKIEELEAERSRLDEENKMLQMRLEHNVLQGDYDPTKTKVLHMSMNPWSLAKDERTAELKALREECGSLRERLRVLEKGGSVPELSEASTSLSFPEVSELRKQVDSAELKNQRLKEIFHKKIQEFRAVCYTLTGYQIDVTTENQYRLTSMYAEQQDDSLMFKDIGEGLRGTEWMILGFRACEERLSIED